MSYLSKNEAENLQNGNVHLARIPEVVFSAASKNNNLNCGKFVPQKAKRYFSEHDSIKISLGALKIMILKMNKKISSFLASVAWALNVS